jgi:hypothetical protein
MLLESFEMRNWNLCWGEEKMDNGVRRSGPRFKAMENWYYFWTFNFIVAGSTFSVIAIIVCIRGIKDLRKMFSDLRQHAPEESAPSR